jgi:hypothetical protein
LHIGPVPLDRLAGLLGQIGHELGEHVLVDRRVLDRGVRENQRVGIEPLARVLRRVGDQIAVVVAEPRIEIAAILALVRDRQTRRADQHRRRAQGGQSGDRTAPGKQ